MTVAVALTDPDVAVMVAIPLPTAVTVNPTGGFPGSVVLPVTTELFDIAHVTVGFDITVPPASLTVATRVAVSPADVKLRLVGDRVIEAAV